MLSNILPTIVCACRILGTRALWIDEGILRMLVKGLNFILFPIVMFEEEAIQGMLYLVIYRAILNVFTPLCIT